MIFVQQSKGKKDRYTILSNKVKKMLLKYLINTNFKTNYLFEGRNGKYAIKSVQILLERALIGLPERLCRDQGGLTHARKPETPIRP